MRIDPPAAGEPEKIAPLYFVALLTVSEPPALTMPATVMTPAPFTVIAPAVPLFAAAETCDPAFRFVVPPALMVMSPA